MRALINNLFPRERLAVVVSSPLMRIEQNNKDQFVCAPGIERASGRAQMEGAVEGLQELGVLERIMGLTYDTTASNSSVLVGTAALLEEEVGKALLKIPCRRHILDLFGKNLRKIVVGRATTGPGHPLFLKFAREWENIRPNIDYGNLTTLDLGPWEGTFIIDLVEELKIWCQTTMNNGRFERSSHQDLLITIAVFIEAPTPPAFRFKMRKPKPVSNGRYAEVAQYSLDIGLLSNQLPWLTDQQREEVRIMAFISAIFYGPGFLKSPLGADASFNDLQSIIHFRKLKTFMPEVANEALATWERHLDYLTPQLINNHLRLGF